eukprot:1933845-Pleurochrysis_carterae.AAC.1
MGKRQSSYLTTRESHPTLYPGKVEGEDEEEPGHQRRNMKGLTDRAKANLHKRERKQDTYRNKRIRLVEGGNDIRRVSDRPGQRLGGGEWELPPLRKDTEARKLMGGRDGRGVQKVVKDEAMNPAHEEKNAAHPILRLFTRPAEMENGTYIRMTKEDVEHMNTASEKQLTLDPLNAAMTLHERHSFHIAVATDGTTRGGTKDRGETQ